MVTVRQHTAKYDAADKMKESLKKKGAGDEFEARKKKLAMEQLAGKGAAEEFEKMLGDDALKENEKVKEGKKTRASKKSEKVSSKKEPRSSKKETKSDQPFTSAEFKEWYEGTGSAADKKVAKALRKSLGRKAYNELSDLAADNYKKGGASSFFKKNVQSKDAKKSSSAKTAKETSPKTAKSRLKQLRGELAALKQKEDESRPKPPKGFKETYFGVKEGSATFKKLWGHPDYGHGFNLLTGKHDFFYEPKSKSKSKPADTGKSIYKVAKKIKKEERRSYQEKYGVTHKEIADLASSEGYYLKSGVFLKKGKNNLKGPYSRPYQYFAKKASQQK